MGRRALVMGGNRYIGLHLVHELVRQGFEVTVMNSHEADLPPSVRRLHGDRRVPGTIAAVLTPVRDEFDIVFDNTAYAVRDLDSMVELVDGRVDQLVFTSSVAVYRRSFVQPVVETSRRHAADDRDPRKAYGVGKVACEDYLRARFESTGLKTTTLRVTHTIGPRSPLVTREPIFFARLEAGRPILVPGEGFAITHLVHVQDVARLMVAVAGNDGAAGQAFNVAGTELTSIVGCIRLMAKAVGVEPTIINVPMEIARTQRHPLVHWGEALTGSAIFSADKARTVLGWEPEFGLEDGYADSYRWFDEGGRDLFEYDFSHDDAVLEQLAR